MDSKAGSGIGIEVGPETMQQILLSRVKMIKYRVMLSPLLLCLSCTAFAQVYKSTDAEGNVTFSDTPTDSSEEVQVKEANVADPVEVPENTSPPPAPEPKVIKTERPPEVTVERDYDDDGGYYGVRPGRIIRRHRRHHSR